MTNSVLRVHDLTRRFGALTAVDRVSFTVERGSILGLLGPNGAGKTTLVRMLTTLLAIGGGTASIAGFDVATRPAEVRARIGLAGQAAAVDEKLTARENLELFGRLYQLPRTIRVQRSAALLAQFDMEDFASRPASTYSGGQRRRLDIAVALIAEPDVLFLDEPTVGLDTRSRREVWRVVQSLADGGTSVVLTTQYLEEADQIADRIVVIDRGRTVAEGTPEELKTAIGRDVLQIRVLDHDALQRAQSALGAFPGLIVRPETLVLEIPVFGGTLESLDALRAVENAGVSIADFQHRRPTLDDVFLALTGDSAHSSPEVAA